MEKKYPQGMRKKPITLSNPDGSSRNFNSYAEALDYADNLKKTRTDYYRSVKGQLNAANAKYDKEYDKSVRQGYKPTTRTDNVQDPVADKEQGLMNTISETNAAWMQRVAKRPTMSQLLKIKK
jgi:hypothetical protein